MKKFNILLAGLAVMSLAASCSSDEPEAPVVTTPVTDGSSAILKVSIKGTATGSRANSDKEEGAYDFGELSEQKVTTANFFFFDADGIYVTQADVWSDNGTDNPEANIDFKSENVLVLKGLNQKHAPKYLITVLNAGNDIASKMIVGTTTIDEFRETLTNQWNYTTTKDAEGNDLLVMSTSSYNGQGESWGCTVLSDDNLQVLNKDENEINAEDIKGLTPVQVYVERLAVKYTLDKANPIKITLTLAGEDNEQTGNFPIAAEEVYVTIDGFGIVNAADKSYLMKHLVTPNNAATWSDWNNDADYRCFWAKSLYYDQTDNTGLQSTGLAKVMANKDFAPVYSNENTKPYTALQLSEAGNRVNASLVTNVVFSATVTKDAAGTQELDLVSYNGVYYKQDQFRKYVLNRMKNSQGQAYSGLNFYKKVSDEYVVEDPKTGVVTTTGAKYVQVEPADLVKVRAKSLSSAEFTYELSNEITELYQKTDDGNAELIAGGVAAFNAQLRKMFANSNVNTDNYPVSYTGGKTYYSIPIEHLIASQNKVVENDGQFGVVRNHWYNFTVTKIMNMGEGVFDPDAIEGGDQISPDPDPQKDKYAMTCQINILSWKIATQNIEL